jgi:hypothetical protein
MGLSRYFDAIFASKGLFRPGFRNAAGGRVEIRLARDVPALAGTSRVCLENCRS